MLVLKVNRRSTGQPTEGQTDAEDTMRLLHQTPDARGKSQLSSTAARSWQAAMASVVCRTSNAGDERQSTFPWQKVAEGGSGLQKNVIRSCSSRDPLLVCPPRSCFLQLPWPSPFPSHSQSPSPIPHPPSPPHIQINPSLYEHNSYCFTTSPTQRSLPHRRTYRSGPLPTHYHKVSTR